MTETIPVRFEVQAVLPVRGKGRLIAMARVEVEIAGVPILLQGFRVQRRPDGGLECHAPAYRDMDGCWPPAVVLPPELAAAIASEIMEACDGLAA
jgi:stage V sporulation protein G